MKLDVQVSISDCTTKEDHPPLVHYSQAHYTRSICHADCAASKLMERCGCKAFFFSVIGSQREFCSPRQFVDCVNNDVQLDVDGIYSGCYCPSLCVVKEVDTTVSYGKLSIEKTKALSERIPEVSTVLPCA